MGGDDVLDDAQAQPRASGDPGASRVDPVEAFEDALGVLSGHADALVGHGDLDALVDEVDSDADSSALRRVVHGVVDEVAHRIDEQFVVAFDEQVARRGDLDVDALALRPGPGTVSGIVDHLGDGDLLGRRGSGVVLDAGEVDDLLHQLGQPLRLPLHSPAEALDCGGVVGEVGDSLGEQSHRTDRRLEFMGHVGDEVAADGVDAFGFGLVVAEDEDEGGSQGRDAGVEVAEHGFGVLPCLLEVDLFDETAGAHAADDPQHLGRGERMTSDQAERVRRRGGFDDIVTGVDDDGGRGQDGQHFGDALGQVVLRMQIGSIAGAFAESERKNSRYTQAQADDAGQDRHD